MTKSSKKAAAPDKSKPSTGAVAALGLLAAGAVAAGAAFLASRRADLSEADELAGGDAADTDMLDTSSDAIQTRPVGEPMRYTGDGTPDMAVNYTPGLDAAEDRTAGDESTAIGTAEQRDTMAGVNA